MDHRGPAARFYELRIACHIAPNWDSFHPLTVANLPDGTALLVGPVRDQSELHGILARVRDLSLPLISVNPLSTNPASSTQEDE